MTTHHAAGLGGLALSLLLACAPRAGAAVPLHLACRDADLVVQGRALAPADELGVTPVRVERVLKWTGPIGEVLGVRGLGSLPASKSVVAFLVADIGAPGRWTPIDPDGAVLLLDGAGWKEADLLAAITLELDPPADPAALAAALAAMLGRGERATAHAAQRLSERADLQAVLPPITAARIIALVEERRVSADTAATLIHLLATLRPPHADAFLVDVVASEAPPVVVSAAADALASVRDAETPELVLHALGGASEAALPGLLDLVAALRARELLGEAHERLASGRAPLRLAAIRACAAIADPLSVPALGALLRHPDPRTAEAAIDALHAIGTHEARTTLEAFAATADPALARRARRHRERAGE